MTKHKEEATTALAVIGDRFPVLNPQTAAEFADVLRENLQGQDIGIFDLERIKVPTGGGQFWSVPSVETGEAEAVKTFDGIIIGFKDTKTFWAKPFGADAGSPPDCTSDDCVTGVGTPGGACAACPFNVFGSKEPSPQNPSPKGKACRDQRLLFVLREGAMMPTLVSLPPSAIKECKSYFMGLASRSLRFSAVVTRFTLLPDKSSGGIDYSLAKPVFVERLEPANAEAVRAYAAAIAPSLARVRDDDAARDAA